MSKKQKQSLKSKQKLSFKQRRKARGSRRVVYGKGLGERKAKVVAPRKGLKARKAKAEIYIVFHLEQPFTPEVLESQVLPFLTAIEDIQNVVDDLNGLPHREVIIRSMNQNSPLSIGIEGAVKAVEILEEFLLPWKRRHRKRMALLVEREKRIEIERKAAEVLEKRALAEKAREEAIRLKLENERLRMELLKEKVELGRLILQQLAPNLSEEERVVYLIRFLPAMEKILAGKAKVSIKSVAG